jgi:hypothetical protein
MARRKHSTFDCFPMSVSRANVPGNWDHTHKVGSRRFGHSHGRIVVIAEKWVVPVGRRLPERTGRLRSKVQCSFALECASIGNMDREEFLRGVKAVCSDTPVEGQISLLRNPLGRRIEWGPSPRRLLDSTRPDYHPGHRTTRNRPFLIHFQWLGHHRVRKRSQKALRSIPQNFGYHRLILRFQLLKPPR